MADLPALLAALEHDPDDAQAFAGLVDAAQKAPPDVRLTRFAAARKAFGGRGRPDIVVALIDAELGATTDVDRKVDLLLEKGMALDGELLDVPAARAAFDEVRRLRPDDTMAAEALDEIDVSASNWKKFADKYISEANASTDRSLATGLYVSAAECYVRFEPGAKEAEQHLRKALEIDSKNGKAAFHLVRLLRRAERWPELAKLLDERAEQAATVEEKVTALLGVAEVARGKLVDPTRADAAIRRALQLDPAQPQALRRVAEAQMAAEYWPGLVATYHAALKARRDDVLAMELQIAMVNWKHIGDIERA
jgi:tetratricopeptide (TPR) repeat protein